jgi:outer membrane protein TolC
MAVNAEQLPDPMLQLSVDNLPVNGSSAYSLTDDFMTMRSLWITQTFTRADKRRARAAVFEREADAAQATRAVALSELRRNTALAWFDCHFQQRMVELLAHQRDEASLQVEAAEAAYRAGRGSQADIFLARSSVADIEDRIRQAQARHQNAATTLARWVGDVAVTTLGSAPDITQTRLATHDLEHQLDEHPDITVMTAREAAALAEAEAARQEERVDWSWSLMYSQRGPDFSNMVSVGVSVPLQWNQRNRQDRVVAAQLAKVEQARAEREEMTREHLAETRRWIATWRSNLDRLSDYDASLIPLASQRTRAALAGYSGAEVDLASVFDARKAEIAIRVERLRIEMETAALWVALEYLLVEDGTQDRVDISTARPLHILEQQP